MARVVYRISNSHPQAALARKQMTLGGTMVTFEVEGGKKKAFDLLRHLGIVDISNNLGDAKSLMTHPASTTRRNIGAEARTMGITDGMVRLSVGLEDTADLVADLKAGACRLEASGDPESGVHLRARCSKRSPRRHPGWTSSPMRCGARIPPP